MKPRLIHIIPSLLLCIFFLPLNTSAALPIVRSISEVKNDTIRNELAILMRNFGIAGKYDMNKDTLKPLRSLKSTRNGDRFIALMGYKSWGWTVAFSSEINNLERDGHICRFDIRVVSPFLRHFNFYHGASGWRTDSTIIQPIGAAFANAFGSSSQSRMELAAYMSIDCRRQYLVIKSINATGSNKMLIIAFAVTSDWAIITDV
jgi:hypothetical protein